MKALVLFLLMASVGCSAQRKEPVPFVPDGQSNLAAAQKGYDFAGYENGDFDHTEWMDIKTAPHDGTVVEIMCYYGVAPWWSLMRWDGERKAWGDTIRDGSYASNENFLRWRPYNGKPEDYVDPTGNVSSNPSFERGAIAAQHDIPRAMLPILESRYQARYRETVSSCPSIADVKRVEISKTVGGEEDVIRLISADAKGDSGVCSFWVSKSGLVRSVSPY